jgi:hypothetical protein
MRTSRGIRGGYGLQAAGFREATAGLIAAGGGPADAAARAAAGTCSCAAARCSPDAAFVAEKTLSAHAAAGRPINEVWQHAKNDYKRLLANLGTERTVGAPIPLDIRDKCLLA